MTLYGSICSVTACAWDFGSTPLPPVIVALENCISLRQFPMCHLQHLEEEEALHSHI